MKARTLEYYDWFQDVQPELLTILNELLVKQGVEPVADFRGGYLKNGKWVETNGKYVDFWHMFLKLWGDDVKNDQTVTVYFPPDEDKEWDYCKEVLAKDNRYQVVSTVFVDAMRTLLRNNSLFDEQGECYGVPILFSW